jgi:hypothetical protein
MVWLVCLSIQLPKLLLPVLVPQQVQVLVPQQVQVLVPQQVQELVPQQVPGPVAHLGLI